MPDRPMVYVSDGNCQEKIHLRSSGNRPDNLRLKPSVAKRLQYVRIGAPPSIRSGAIWLLLKYLSGVPNSSEHHMNMDPSTFDPCTFASQAEDGASPAAPEISTAVPEERLQDPAQAPAVHVQPVGNLLQDRGNSAAAAARSGSGQNRDFIHNKLVEKVYNFFMEKHLEALKEVLKFWKLNRSGAKDEIVARCVAYAMNSSFHSTLADVMARLEDTPYCDGFLMFDEEKSDKWSRPPPFRKILADANKRTKGNTVRDPNSSDSQRFSSFEKPLAVNEVARLMLILQDQKGRDAFRLCKASANRDQVNSTVTRMEAWDETIANLFYDKANTVNIAASSPGFLIGVGYSKPPDYVRTGMGLRAAFNKLRFRFTYCYNKWVKSGQPSDSFLDYTKGDSGQLTPYSIHLVIMFQVMRCGSSNQDDDLLQMLLVHTENDGILDCLDFLDEMDKSWASGPSFSAPSYVNSDSLKRRSGLANELEIEHSLKLQRRIPTSELQPLRMNLERVRLFSCLRICKNNLVEAQQSGDNELIYMAQKNLNRIRRDWKRTEDDTADEGQLGELQDYGAGYSHLS